MHICVRHARDSTYTAHATPAALLLPLAPLVYVLATTKDRRASFHRWLASLPAPATELDSQFGQWLHRKLSAFEMTALALLSAYWYFQSWLR